MKAVHENTFTACRNACKLCTPLGACLTFRGIEATLPFLHGSQGCATYIRRYFISHFREPVDIASSSFDEQSAIFGGGDNLHRGLRNVIEKYKPQMIGVATTCLTETIGEDMPMLIRQFVKESQGDALPAIIPVSTPSYQGTHVEGFHAAVRAVVESLAEPGGRAGKAINILPGMVSPADQRHIKEIIEDFELPYVMLPDYSETLDAPTVAEYEKIASGGTTLNSIRGMGQARATISFGSTIASELSAGCLLQQRCDVPEYRLGLPIGIKQTDAFFDVLGELSGQVIPQKYFFERGRLIDAYVDGHKYVFGKRAVVYGQEDMVVGIAAFLAEIGIIPVLCASGAESGRLNENIRRVTPELTQEITVLEGADFLDIEQAAANLQPDLIIGNSKGYTFSRKLGVPLVRVGFPIHDRIGGPRLLHLGYRGAGQLFDRIVNTLIEAKQSSSPVGYTYI